MLYRFGDLTLASDQAFTQLLEVPAGNVECRIERASEPERGAPEEGWDHHWRTPAGDVALSCSRDGERYRLGVRELATFVIEGRAGTITCRAHPDLPSATLEHLVIDQILPRVLTHRGRLVLHAGCVVAPDGAIAFLGESGSGKSTLCGAFARAGDPIVGDDGIVVRRTHGGGFDVLATYPGLRLLPGPLRSLFGDSGATIPMAHDTPKRRMPRAGSGISMAAGPVPLRAVYLLETGPRIEIGRVAGPEAFVGIVRSCFPLHLDDEERSRELFERIGALLDRVPVRRLSYPREYARLAEVREALLEDLVP